MSSPVRFPASSWLPRRTIRLRLTLYYGGLFLLSGVALLGVTYLLVRLTPPAASIHSYSFTQPPRAAPPARSPALRWPACPA